MSSPFLFLSHSFCSYSSHSSHLASYVSSYTSLPSLLFTLLNISANIQLCNYDFTTPCNCDFNIFSIWCTTPKIYIRY
jgi:hypothetical protein